MLSDDGQSDHGLSVATKQEVQAWIAAWRQRTAPAQAPAAEPTMSAAEQPLATPQGLQAGMAAAIGSTGRLAAAKDSATPEVDDSEESMLAARQGAACCLKPFLSCPLVY